MRMAAAVPLVLAFAAAAPAGAGAAIAFSPCAVAGYECGRLEVPLDRSHAVPGTVNLAIVRARASSNPTNSAVVALAGGPGQSGTPLASDFAEALGPALATRDFFVFDARGTGASDPLSCPSLDESGAQAVLGCAQRLGAARGFYRTADSVQDLEAVRAEAGYDRLVLYGVSYGTKVALAYAAAHPDRVERLVLDSVVATDGPDPFRRSSFHAIPRMLADLCGSRCRTFTTSPRRDLAKLVTRIRKRPLSGRVVDGRGRRRTQRLSESGLFEVLLAGDLNPALRSELPGAVHSALSGDSTPILRLRARAEGLGIGDQAPAADVNPAVFFATSCEDATLPWPRTESSVDARVDDATQAAQAISSASVAPFSRATAVGAGLIPLCVAWLAASPQPAVVGDPPLVPTLVLSGAGDLRTPLEDAQRVAAKLLADVVTIPRTGHSVLGSDLTSCTHDAVVAFFADRPVSRCPVVAPTFAPVPPPPTRLARVPRTAGLPGNVGRTFTALRLTLRDLRLESVGVALAQGRRPNRIGGLRGGYADAVDGGLLLHAASYVPGVAISGTVPDRGTSVLRVTGRAAARGSLTVTEAGSVTGRLGGKRVAIALASNVLRPGGAAWARVPGPLARVP